MQSDRSYTCLLNLLRLALGERVSAMFPSLSPDEWREVYRLAAKHAVIAIVWDGVEQLQQQNPEVLLSMPADLMGKWFADVHAIEAANIRMTKLAAKVQNILNDGGFDSQVLKGSTLAVCYPKPGHRQSADIDLWVLPHGNEPLRLTAFRQQLLAFLHRQPQITVGEVVYHHIETMIDGTEVEFHITPTWLCNPWHNRRLQQLFCGSRSLTPELQELYTLMHAFRHIWHDGIALRHLLDYYFVSHKNRQQGIPAPAVLYRQLGLNTFVQAMDELVACCLHPQDNRAQTSLRAMHILQALPERQVSGAVCRDYPQEHLFNLPWRAMHYLWRKRNNYL